MKKLRTARILMALSVLVIAAFQVYWLVTLYNDKSTSIHKNTDIVFKETLYQLQVIRFKNDSLFRGLPGDNLFMMDMANVLRREVDTTLPQGHRRKVFISINNNIDTSPVKNMVFKDSINDENIIIRHGGKPPPFTHFLKDSSQLYDSIPT